MFFWVKTGLINKTPIVNSDYTHLKKIRGTHPESGRQKMTILRNILFNLAAGSRFPGLI
jgi:hypothetical protein